MLGYCFSFFILFVYIQSCVKDQQSDIKQKYFIKIEEITSMHGSKGTAKSLKEC